MTGRSAITRMSCMMGEGSTCPIRAAYIAFQSITSSPRRSPASDTSGSHTLTGY